MTSKILSIARVQNYWRRQGVIKYFFILLFTVFLYQTISISTNTYIQKRGENQSTDITTKYAQRGDILDRDGNILASNLILRKVILDPTQVQKEFIPKLAKALIIPEQDLHNAIEKKLSKKAGRKYLVIKKNIMLTSPIIKNLKELRKQRVKICKNKNIKNKHSLIDKGLSLVKIKELKDTYTNTKDCKKKGIEGMAIREDTRRYYPKAASLAPLLGRVNSDKKGVSGIEGEFEYTLAGQNIKESLTYNSESRGSYFNSKTTGTLTHGENIELTIDSKIQFHAYAAIKKSVDKYDADSGSAIILNPNGEILAMVNYPADDPNDRSTYNAEHYRNRVLSDKVEPGSTMKPFTMLLALDKDKISATDDELIDVSKSIGHIRSDKDAKRYGDAITVKKILQKSHNLGTVNISERLSKEDMYETWSKLGFGRPLGLIPSIENSGSLRHFSSWGLADKRTLAFGYGPMETNLAQLARAYLVFANNGSVPPLKLIKNSNTYENTVKIFDKKTTKKIAELLNAVASNDGSGYRAVIKGYDVAGKTGTAEMVVDGIYNKKGAKRTFFTGFVPVDKPKYIMAVRLDYPKKCYASWKPSLKIPCQGSNSAAVAFKDAMQSILTNDSSIKLMANK